MKSKAKKNKPLSAYESVKISRAYVDKVRAIKKATRVSISAYIEQAIDLKINEDLMEIVLKNEIKANSDKSK